MRDSSSACVSSFVAHLFVELLEVVEASANDLYSLFDLLFSDHEGWRQSDRGVVGGLGEQTVLAKDLGEVVTVDVQVVAEFDSNEETAPSHLSEHALIKLQKLVLEQLSHLCGVLNHSFLNNGLDGGLGDGHAKRVTSVGAAVVTRLDLIHDEAVSEAAAHWQHSTRHALAHHEDVGAHLLVLHCEHLPCASEAGLNLISDHEDVVLGAEGSHCLEVALLGDDHATFALDRLNADSADVGVSSELSPEPLDVIVGEKFEAGREWAKVRVAGRVVTRPRSSD